MFKHSVRVPRLYKVAAKVAKGAKEGLGSIKQLVYENRSKHPNIKAIYALVATLFEKDDEIENLLKRSQLLVKEPRSDPWLTRILIVELLWGKKSLPGESKPEKTVLAYEQIFRAHISDIPTISKKLDQDEKEDTKPRYVRVNTLYMDLNEAVDGFRDEGWVLSKFLDKMDYKGFLDKITSLSEEEFLIDIHIPNLLIFPPKTQFYNHPAYKKGAIVLQDKASCLPVHILDPPPGSTVLDMCSAPGMKTTQVAAAMNNEGKVYAVERDPRRFETLNKLVAASGATCITTVNKDVLTCAEKDFPGVQYILVDPSCSGSGMTDRLGFEQAKSNQRMEKLAGFQIKILRSALTRYPDARRVVYSTCSIFPEENEDVVRQVLETNSAYKLVPATKFVNNTWKNFGSKDYGDIGSYCLYAKPNEDFTNGFFVAVFERLEEGEENQFFNTKIYNFKKHVQSQENRKRRQQQAIGNDNFGNNYQDQDLEPSNKYSFEENVFNKVNKETFIETNSSGKKKKKKNINIYENNENCLESESNQNKKRKFAITNEYSDINIKEEKEESDKEFIKDKSESDNSKKKKKRKDLSADLSKNVETGDVISEHLDFNTKQNKEKSETEVVKQEFPESKKNKKKKKRKCFSENVENDNTTSECFNINLKVEPDKESTKLDFSEPGKPKKKKKKNVSENFSENVKNGDDTSAYLDINVQKQLEKESIEEEFSESVKNKKKKKRKNISEEYENVETSDTISVSKIELDVKKKKNKTIDSKKGAETKIKSVEDNNDDFHSKVKHAKKKKEKNIC